MASFICIYVYFLAHTSPVQDKQLNCSKQRFVTNRCNPYQLAL